MPELTNMKKENALVSTRIEGRCKDMHTQINSEASLYADREVGELTGHTEEMRNALIRAYTAGAFGMIGVLTTREVLGPPICGRNDA